MPSAPSTPRRSTSGRRRGRPPGSTNALRAARQADAATEPPPKRRKYVPGGPGGGGRFVDEEGAELPVEPVAVTAPRPRVNPTPANPPSSPLFSRREPSTRTRSTVSRYDPDEERYGSAAAVAAAVAQSEGYKPREERGWEEFHPSLDIEATFMVFHADDVDGVAKSTPPTPAVETQSSVNNSDAQDALPSAGVNSGALIAAPNSATPINIGTPSRRRAGRPPRDSIFYGTTSTTPKTPKVLPIHNQTPKEKLDLKLPSYRKTDRILLFESKTFGQARYVDKAMMNVGYQETDNYFRPDRRLIKANDTNGEDETDPQPAGKEEGETHVTPTNLGRVEYDMDEQDDMWLERYNAQRKAGDNEAITREIFEITITKIEKEWHALEKRIPKPNPKPPQTHRPRSSSAAAVNGETQAGEEQDSKCAICDDGDCENTNAIVFCDGCDLAVHQECYGVPFIPEGQWLCRKCQLIGRGVPTCIFCPNTDGAFKQTNSSKWAHLLCAMWIPEVSLGNHTFMEPVMEVEKVPKNRWKLHCYLCNQSMGACIQCGNKACYEAFHVTCARRAHLYLKMKNSHGTLAVLDGSMVLKAFCHKHCPPDYAEEHDVKQATKAAMRFFKRTMKGRIWVNSQASALAMAALHPNVILEHPPDESQMTGAKLDAALSDKKKGQPGKAMWKLPSGAPIIPQAVFDIVEASLQRFTLRKRKDFVADACRYWTLKREARRGAALLKRLQLQMETFTSMELTRRNFATMGPSGKARLARRIEFAKNLLGDLEQLKALADDVVLREADKLEGVELEQNFVDTAYFPIHKLLLPPVDKAISLDKGMFKEGLAQLRSRVDERFYTTTLTFTYDLCEVIRAGINIKNDQPVDDHDLPAAEPLDVSPSKHSSNNDLRDRKRLGKRILRAVQPQLEVALKAESEINNKSFDTQLKELERRIESSLEVQAAPATELPDVDAPPADQIQDVIMADVGDEGEIVVADVAEETVSVQRDGDGMDVDEPVNGEAMQGVSRGKVVHTNGMISSTASVAGPEKEPGEDHVSGNGPNGVESSDTPPADNGYIPVAHRVLPGPLTPPQSNGSLGRGPADILTDGGIPWYMKGFNLEGTSAAEEQWTGREAVRSLSEDLTDMDEEELNGLEFDVEDSTITASPVSNDTASAAVGSAATSKKRGAAGRFRKGIRTSARRR